MNNDILFTWRLIYIDNKTCNKLISFLCARITHAISTSIVLGKVVVLRREFLIWYFQLRMPFNYVSVVSNVSTKSVFQLAPVSHMLIFWGCHCALADQDISWVIARATPRSSGEHFTRSIYIAILNIHMEFVHESSIEQDHSSKQPLQEIADVN